MNTWWHCITINLFSLHSTALGTGYLLTSQFTPSNYNYGQTASTAVSVISLGRIWWKLLSHNFGKKVLFLTCLNDVFLVTDDFCIKWFCPKNVIFCLKNAFFWQKMQYIPLATPCHFRCQETFFPMVFLYLNPEGQLKAT